MILDHPTERPCIRNKDGTFTPLWQLAIKTSPEEANRREKFEEKTSVNEKS